MATLLVLLVGWLVLGGLWLLSRFAEIRECRSVDAFQASRSVLSEVIGRAAPAAPSAGAKTEVHVRLLEEAEPRPVADAATATAVAAAPVPPRRRHRAGSAQDRSDRSAPAVAAAADPGAPAPPIVLRFGDDEAPEATAATAATAAGGAPAPGPTAQATGQPASRHPRRLAGQVAAAAAAAVALALLAPPAAGLLGNGTVIPSSDVERIASPTDEEPADPDVDLARQEAEEAPPSSSAPQPEVIEPTPSADGPLRVEALGPRAELELVALQDVWMELREGGPTGSVVWTGTLPAGRTDRVEVDTPAHLRIGNPGGLSLVVDGRTVRLTDPAPVNLVLGNPGL